MNIAEKNDCLFFYHWFCMTLVSNCELSTLRIAEASEGNNQVFLHINIADDANITIRDTADINEDKRYFYLNLRGVVKYTIDKEHDIIYADSSNIKYIEDSLLNLPAALFFLGRGLIVLHASSVYDDDNNAYAFCAPKGTGKSVFCLSLLDRFSFLSDDSLLVLSEKGLKVCGGSNLIKMSENASRFFCEKNIIIKKSEKALESQKYLFYSDRSEVSGTRNLKAMFYIERCETEAPDISGFLTKNEKKYFFLQNVIGLKHMSNLSLQNVFDYNVGISVLSDVPVIKMEIPNRFQMNGFRFKEILQNYGL